MKMKAMHACIDHGEAGEMIEDVGVIVGLVVLQFLYAGNSFLLGYLLKLGIHPPSLIIFSTFVTFLLLAPLSFFFERSQWPRRFGCKLIVQLLLLSFGGVTVFQRLFMKGVNLTSPAMATAMPNLAPGLIFFIAWAFRLEKIKAGCRLSRAKIAGTLLCVIGAVVMSVMQSTVQDRQQGPPAKEEAQRPFSMPTTPDHESDGDNIFDKDIIIGSIYLIAAVFVLSTQVVLQAITLRDFPAPISLCAITSLIGVLITATIQIIEDRGLDSGWPFVTYQEMIAYSILVGSVSGLCVSFNAWAMKKRGPVMVSIFNPLATVISVILSVITLGQSIGIGSLAGMCLMFTGLYFVLWAKGKEGYSGSCSDEDDNMSSSENDDDYDLEKPLLLAS